MEVVDLSQNDDLIAVIRKCNLNFKQLYYTLTQSSRKQRRLDNQEVDQALQELGDNLVELQNVIMPQAIADSIAALDVPGQIADRIADLDVPGQIAAAIPDAYPPVGSYEISDTMPTYDGTTWVQVDTVNTTGSLSIPLWQRTA